MTAKPLEGRRLKFCPLRFGARRREVLAKGALRLGATIVEDETDGDYDVIVAEDADVAAAAAGHPGRRLLSCGWLSAALKTGSAPDEGPFILSTKAAVKTVEEASVREQPPAASPRKRRAERESEEGGSDSELSRDHLAAFPEAPEAKRLSPEKKALFVCAQDSRSPSSSKTPTSATNALIVENLRVLAEGCTVSRDRWRALSYEKAANAVARYPRPIQGKADIDKLPGVGARIGAKIQEILDSGRLRKAEAFQSSEHLETLKRLEGIWGVGPVLAEQWYAAGIRSLDDVAAKAKLSRQQEIGLRHYADLQLRMPRAEAAEIVAVVTEAVEGLDWISGVHCEACGSFRRGRADCGDVDILLSHPQKEHLPRLLGAVVEQLRRSGFLTDDLVETSEETGGRKYMGVCRLDGEGRRHRRLDIIAVPWEELASSLLYFTGSAHFTRSIYALAKRLGMRLNQHGLYGGVMRSHGEKLNKGFHIPTPTEESIFQRLGIPFRSPQERDHP